MHNDIEPARAGCKALGKIGVNDVECCAGGDKSQALLRGDCCQHRGQAMPGGEQR